MAENSIALRTEFLEELDMEYKEQSLTAVLDTPNTRVGAGSKANTVKIAKMSLQGLGDYSKSDGYPSGNATLTYEEHTLAEDRGRKFDIDAMDNQESANIAFGMLAGVFTRTKTVPEFDAYRMAKYAGYANTTVAANLSTGANVLAAIDVATKVMNKAEVPKENRKLFISCDAYALLKGSATLTNNINQVNAGVIDRNIEMFNRMEVIEMPPTRFYSAITTADGSAGEEEDGGYAKTSGAKDINFMIIQPDAILYQGIKHLVTKIITPEANQDSDGWLYFFRAYHDALVYDNKVTGIYCHTVA